MEEKSLLELHFAPYNPRTMSEHSYGSLKDSIRRFGDLSGVTFNITTGNLVGGHQRVRAFKELLDAGATKAVTVDQRYAQPTPVGTVAEGFIIVAGERFKYREVQWSLDMEKAANIAANKIGGEFNKDQLAELTASISEEMRSATGQTNEEINKLLASVGIGEEDEKDRPEETNNVSFALTTPQVAVVMDALKAMKTKHQLPNDSTPELNGLALYHLAELFLGSAAAK